MSVEHVGYHEVTIIAAQATRTGPPGMITLRYALSAVPLSWERHFHEAYATTGGAPAHLKGIEGEQLVLTIREAEATEPTLAAVRRNIDQAVAVANHQTRAYLAAAARVEHAQDAQAQSGEERLNRVQDILDKQ